MALDPRQAIDSLLAAFNVSRETTKRLEDTLALERRVADEAITEANANTVALSLTLGADIAKLQQEIVDLKDAAAQRERDVIDASNDWRKKLSGALEGFNNSATLRARCTELDETVDTLKQENKDLKRRLAEAAEAQAEDDDAEESAQEKRYDALQAKYNELKRAYSEIHAVQEERMSIAEEHERLALEAAQQQADAEGALERLQAQYDDLKNKKPARRKNNEVVDDLHKQVEQLTAELAKASKITEGAVKKLGKCTTANVELTRKYKAVQKERDQLDAANAALAKQSKGALKTTEATSEKYDELKAIAISLEADNEKLQLANRNLWTEKNSLSQACDEIIEAGENMDVEASALRRNVAALREDCRSLETRLAHSEEVNQAFRTRLQTGRVSPAVARVLYDDLMSTFVTSIRERPDLNTIQPIAKAGTEADLRALLNSNSVGAGYIDRILYFPKRMLWTSDAQLHALAFAPAEHYERDGTGGSWRPATEIADLKGQWRELFVDLDGAIVYAGTYRCHDLRYLCPGGTPAPEHISPLELLHAAGLGEVSPAERARALSGSENGNGVLRVDCVGLQCFGFNGTLYDALKRLTRGMKRDLAEAERPDEGPTKRRHVG